MDEIDEKVLFNPRGFMTILYINIDLASHKIMRIIQSTFIIIYRFIHFQANCVLYVRILNFPHLSSFVNKNNYLYHLFKGIVKSIWIYMRCNITLPRHNYNVYICVINQNTLAIFGLLFVILRVENNFDLSVFFRHTVQYRILLHCGQIFHCRFKYSQRRRTGCTMYILYITCIYVQNNVYLFFYESIFLIINNDRNTSNCDACGLRSFARCL